MRIRVDPSDLVLEIISIVIAIILATAVGQAVENARAHARTHAALHEICLAIVQDDRSLADVGPLHERVRASYLRTLQRAHGERLGADAFSDAFTRAAPRGFHPFAASTTAWDLARNEASLENAPYDVQVALESRFAEAALLDRNDASFIDHIEAGPTDDEPNFYFIASGVASILGDVVASENRLTTDDRAARAALRRDGDC